MHFDLFGSIGLEELYSLDAVHLDYQQSQSDPTVVVPDLSMKLKYSLDLSY